MTMVYAYGTSTPEADLFRCIPCYKDFKHDEDLYNHLCNSRHPYCFNCGQDEQITYSLSDHFKDIHSNFTCPECSMVFFLRNAWRNHMKSHWDYRDPRKLFLRGVMDPGESLQDFADRISPPKEFYERCSEIINRIEKFMNHNTSFKNGSILMAGSVGKKTALVDGADIDIMYYLKNTNLDNMTYTRPKIIERLKQHIENGDLNFASVLKLERTTPFSVKFRLSVGNQPDIPVDFLPVVDILKRDSKANREELYTRMMTMESKTQDYCKRCLSRVQVDFVRQVPRNLKRVIRVIKSWVKKIKKDEKCGSVLSYFCELVVIRTWMNQRGQAKQDIDLLTYVKLVLHELCFCETIRIVWPERYDHHNYREEIDGPMVLDPANPFCNVAPTKQHAAVLSRKARNLIFKKINSVIFMPDAESPRGTKYTEPCEYFEEGEANKSRCGRKCLVAVFVFVLVTVVIWVCYLMF